MVISATQRIKMGSGRESGWIAALDGVAMKGPLEEVTSKIGSKAKEEASYTKNRRRSNPRRGNS